MNDISWQDKFTKDSLEENTSGSKITNKYSPSDSYANQFINRNAALKQNNSHGQKSQSTFSERYIESAQNKRSIQNIDNGYHGDVHQPKDPWNKGTYQQRDSTKKEFSQPIDSESNEKEPVFEYNVMNMGDRKSSSAWNFLNLRNKKQTGDLYKKILFFHKKSDFKVFNFISSRGREGVSTVVANLVDYVHSQAAEKKLLVIDANLQSPNLHTIFNISNNPHDLVDVFNNRIGVREAVTPISSNIFVLSCGKGNTKISGNLEQDNFIKLLNYCRQLYDYIFIDCPPVLSSPDALSVAPAADLTFLIIQSAKVQRPVMEKAKSLLQNEECQIGGVVLNRVQQVIPGWLYKFI